MRAKLKNFFFGIHRVPLGVWLDSLLYSIVVLTFFWMLLAGGKVATLQEHMGAARWFLLAGTIFGAYVWLDTETETEEEK